MQGEVEAPFRQGRRPTSRLHLVATTPRARPSIGRRAVRSVVALGAFGAVTYLLFVVSTRIYPGDADKASIILAGQAMGGGNWLLHGWILTNDSLWATDVLFYAVAVHIFGVRPILFHLESAFVAALCVAVGACIAVQGRRGKAIPVGVLTVAALLVLPTYRFAYFMVGDGFHVSTALVALLAFLLLRRGSADWSAALAVVLLALGMASDFLLVAYALVPLLVAAGLAALRQRQWQPALVPAAAAIAGTALGLLLGWGRSALGGFGVVSEVPIAHAHQMLLHLKAVPTDVAILLGFDTRPYARGVVALDLARAHIVGAAVVTACLLTAVAALGLDLAHRRRRDASRHRDRFLDDCLLGAVAGPVVTFVLLTETRTSGAHYLVPGVLFAAVLSARVVARAWERFSPGLVPRLLGAAGVAALLCAAAEVGLVVAAPAPTPPVARLVSFLERHHLTRGLGAYWSASVCTVESDEQVVVRPVADSTGRIGRRLYESPTDWYSGETFQFLVYQTPRSDRGVNLATAARSWGPPKDTYAVAGYHILVWAFPLRVPPSGLPVRPPS